MGVKDVFDRMPESVRNELRNLENERRKEIERRGHDDISREKAAAYTKGLRDAGIITDRERMALYILTSVHMKERPAERIGKA